jgi:hypothetical protein
MSLVASTDPSRGRSQRSLLVSVGTTFRTDTLTPHEPCIAFYVELSDGNYSLVPEAEDGGADAEL